MKPSERTPRTNYPKLANAVGKRIKQLRTDRGIACAELSREVGKSNGYASQLERGYILPSLPMAHRLADALGVEVSDLLPPHADAVRWSA